MQEKKEENKFCPYGSFDPVDVNLEKSQPEDNVEPDFPENADIKLIFFDMGKVVIPFDWTEVLNGFAEHIGCSVKELASCMKSLVHLGFEDGRCDQAKFVKVMNAILDCNMSEAEFERLWNRTFVECPDMVKVLDALQGQVRLRALSNTNETHYRFIRDELKAYRHFEHLTLSHLVRSTMMSAEESAQAESVMKPSKFIYEKALERAYADHGILRHQCLFIDDKIEFVRGAIQSGMNAIQYDGDIADFKSKLKRLGFVLD
jgi:FMN phosphatase YigB (HAD superfamily)